MEEEKFDNPNEEKIDMTSFEEGAELPEETPEPEQPDKEETKETVGEEEFQIPEKFRDKDKIDIAKSYVELERLRQKDLARLEEKAKEKAEELVRLQQEGKQEEAQEVQADLSQIEKDIEQEIEKAKFDEMDPKDFAKFIVERTKKLAQAIADERAAQKFQSETTLREKIRAEIKEVGEEFPILRDKSKPEFRELVLDIIGAARGRGQNIGLRDAVIKAHKALGISTTSKEPPKKPKPIEKSQPTAVGEDKDTEEEEVKKRILGAGQSSGPLRGL